MAKRRTPTPRQEKPFEHRPAAENSLWQLLYGTEPTEDPDPWMQAHAVRLAECTVRTAIRRPDVVDLDDLVEIAEAELQAAEKAVDLLLVEDRQTQRWKPQANLGWRAAPDLQQHLERYPVLAEKAAQSYGAEAILSWAGLSPQEGDVVMLRAAGLTVEAIATMLRIRPQRVENLIMDAHSQIQVKLAKYLKLSASEAV
jgi:DNA-binding CsgD family transcriptional regulator